MHLDLRHAAVSALLLAAACATGPAGWPDDKAASAKRFERHVTTLAGDDFQGREAGTPGYDKAVAYVAREFRRLGVEPAGEDGFLQQVPLRRSTRVMSGMEAVLLSGGERTALDPVVDILLSPPADADPGAAGAVAEAEGGVVFAGYGIEAPGLGIDSYEGIDAEGKIVLLMQGAPEGLPSEEAAHFGSGTTKQRIAAEKGAAAVLFIGTQDSRTESFRQQMDAYAAKPVETFAGRAADIDGLVTGYIFDDAAHRLFETAGLSLDVARAPDAEGRVAAVALPLSLALRAEAAFENYTAPNVLGMIEGSDPALKGEVVVLSAHLDHVGVHGEGEDRIHNGALDNATGIATMLEAARRFTKGGEAPRRSILFAAVTAEEKGLLGSDYLARNPVSPDRPVVANVNLDMPILLYDFADVIAFGAEHSTLGDTVARAAGSMGIAVTPDPYPEMVLFVRSDHYSFVKQGVPSVFLFMGSENGGDEVFKQFMRTHYHRPSDEIDLPIDYEAGARFSELNYRIAREIADADEAPAWVPGRFFGDLFGKPAP